MMKRCLYCYGELAEAGDFHLTCSREIFGVYPPPAFAYTEADMPALALEAIRRGVALTGAQPKLPMDISGGEGSTTFTVGSPCGAYMVKPPSDVYPNFPENEDLTMHLAALCNIDVVPHTLIRMKSGTLAYVIKRIDRHQSDRYPMEDMAQLTGRMTEEKYDGTYEEIAEAIRTYSVRPQQDVIDFYDLTLFAYLTGNADMHLKNFSLIDEPGIGYHLAPAYDLANVSIVKKEKKELTLTLNGVNSKLRKADFEKAMIRAGMSFDAIDKLFTKYNDQLIRRLLPCIGTSFLPDQFRTAYADLVSHRFEKLFTP